MQLPDGKRGRPAPRLHNTLRGTLVKGRWWPKLSHTYYEIRYLGPASASFDCCLAKLSQAGNLYSSLLQGAECSSRHLAKVGGW